MFWCLGVLPVCMSVLAMPRRLHEGVRSSGAEVMNCHADAGN